MTTPDAASAPRPSLNGGRWGRSALLTVGSAAVSAAVLGVLWFANDLDAGALARAFDQVSAAQLLAICAASALFHIFVGAHKSQCVLRSMGVPIGFREALAVRLGADPLRLLLPLRSGELAQMLYFWARKDVALSRASGLAIFDRGLNLFGALFWLALGVALLPEPLRWLQAATGCSDALVLRIAMMLLVAVVAVIIFLWAPLSKPATAAVSRVSARLGRVLQGMTAPLDELSPWRKVFFLAYGIVFQTRPLLVCWALLWAHGVAVDLDRLLARASVAVLAGQLPGTMAGAGPRETALVELLDDGVTAPEVLLSVGLWMTLAVNVIPMLLGLPWTLWFVRSLRRPGRSVEEDR